jgi:hypothetical protein
MTSYNEYRASSDRTWLLSDTNYLCARNNRDSKATEQSTGELIKVWDKLPIGQSERDSLR